MRCKVGEVARDQVTMVPEYHSVCYSQWRGLEVLRRGGKHEHCGQILSLDLANILSSPGYVSVKIKKAIIVKLNNPTKEERSIGEEHKEYKHLQKCRLRKCET